MSISSEITRISNAKTAIAESIANKGVTVPSGTKIDGMATLIDSIQTGGAAVQPSKALTVTSNGTTTITPDAPYDAIKQVDLTVNVASGGGGGAGFKVTFPATATNWGMIGQARLALYNGTFVGIEDYSVIAGQTVNGVIGIQCEPRVEYNFYVLKMTIEKGAIAWHDAPYIPNTRMMTTQAGTSTPTPYGGGSGFFWWPIADTVISAIQMYNTD